MHNLVIITRPLRIYEAQKNQWEINVAMRGKGLGPLFVHKLTATNVADFKMV